MDIKFTKWVDCDDFIESIAAVDNIDYRCRIFLNSKEEYVSVIYNFVGRELIKKSFPTKSIREAKRKVEQLLYEYIYEQKYHREEDPRITDFLKMKSEETSTKSKDFITKELESFPPGCNPFHYDHFNMGTQIGDDVLIMHSYLDEAHRNRVRYLIITDIVTGRRLRVELPFLGDANAKDKL